MNRYRVLVIGLDGATYDLIKPWAFSGDLPTFARLMNEGTWGNLESTIPPMTAPAWTSFMTGKNPGKHGLYDWIQREEGGYDVYPLTSAHSQQPSLWSILSSSNKRVCTLNVPMTFPPYPVNGVMVSGLPAPSTRHTITFPKNLLQEIEQAVGEYLLYPDPGQAYSDSGVDAFLERLYRTTDTRLQTLDYLRRKENWDFCMAVINGTDTVQHAMWKFMDSRHPLYNPRKQSKYGNAIFKYYQYIDQALGRIVETLGQDSVLMLMSDHGFGPFHKFIHVNLWLYQQGWLKVKSSAKTKIKKVLFDLGFTPMHIYDLMMSLGFGAIKREVVRGHGQDLLKTLFLSFDDVDWAQTKAYSLGNVGQIRINLAGREPQGCVAPGKQYEQVREDIVSQLWTLCDPVTKERVVEKIYRSENIYSGDSVGKGPDIVFLPTRMEYFGFGEYEFGSNEIIEKMKRGISGTHRMNGMFLLWGEPIRSGVQLAGARIIDLAPTILHLMGEPVLSDMDGRVLTNAFLPEFNNPLSYSGYSPEEVSSFQIGGSSEGFSDADKNLLSERLRSLGYMG